MSTIDENIEKIKKINEYGLSNTELAAYLGVSRQQLNRMAKGERNITEEHLSLLEVLENFYTTDEPLRLLFDYVRVRFATTNVDYILKNIMLINLDIIEPDEWAFYGYTKQYAFGDVVVMFHDDDNDKGTLIELKGKGCRQFEQMLAAQNRTWRDFFMTVVDHGGIMKRIDVAIDDMVGILDIPYFIKKHETEECETIFRKYNTYASSEMKKGEDDEKLMGNTLYIGSKKSELYFCLYEKDYERYLQTGVLPVFHEVKNRFEIRLRNERATKMIEVFLVRGELESVTFDIINRYMSYRTSEDGRKLKDCRLDSRWQIFLGIGRDKLRLTTKPEPVTLERTWKWIKKQVAPTLKGLTIIDELMGTNELAEAIEDADLQPRQTKLITMKLHRIEDVIIDPD